jgi:hypothetical protein
MSDITWGSVPKGIVEGTAEIAAISSGFPTPKITKAIIDEAKKAMFADGGSSIPYGKGRKSGIEIV